ncbi:VirB4 family type IV secretion system protein [Lysinibacillus xylanilyticus]|uniref:VirB4 family type IV secretion system protein n=1 Tax=Lysinibacillus xylanilyticus TaxID=582475 RepID=UPI00382F295A
MFKKKKQQEEATKETKTKKSFFKQSKKASNTVEPPEQEMTEEDSIMNMKPTVWDVIAPDGIGITALSDDSGTIKQSFSTETHFQPFYISRDGYPRKLQTNWLNDIVASGECDVMIDVQKIPKSLAVRMLQKQNTILKSNLHFQAKRGNQDQILDIQTKIADNEILAEETQFDENDLYHVSVSGILYGDSKRSLDKYREYLEDLLAGSFIKIVSTWGRVKKGIRSNSPLGKNELPDSLRNIDRRALSTFAPFISGSGKFNGGIPIGNNMRTGQKEFYNAFGTKEFRPPNYNMAILGIAGSGKSIAMKLLLSRETTGMNVYSRLIDVEGEYVRIVKRLKGINITLSEDSKVRINPLAIHVTTIPYDEDDEELDELEDGDERVVVEREDGQKFIQFVPIREKINEATDFFDILCRGKNQEDSGLDVFERNYAEEALTHLYTVDERFQYRTHPSSLFLEGATEENGRIIQTKVKKPEPTLTDVFNYLLEKYETEPKAERLLATIRPFLADGSKPIFDGQTYFGKDVDVNIHTTKLVNFNLKNMEEGYLRPIAYHVILNYVWEYFVKNIDNELKKKVVYADEFWTMVDNEQTVSFSEKMARRARKRNAGFRIASQDFIRILESKKARGVLQNTYTFMFFEQNSVDLSAIEENFNLTRGERKLIFENPEKGECILRIGKSSVHLRTDPSTSDLEFIESNAAVLAESRKRRAFANS